MLALCQRELLRVTASSNIQQSANILHERPSFFEQNHSLSNRILDMTDRLTDSVQHQDLSRVPEIM